MNDEDYVFITQLVKEKSGLSLPQGKHYLIESRLQPIVREAGLESLSDLLTELRRFNAKPALREAVVDAMTTNETFFFRDKLPFEYFSDVMMPHLLEARAAKRTIRIWCAAASTGQEPYSLAMCLQEMKGRLQGWQIDILATDISSTALARAEDGCYSAFEVQRGLPSHFLEKYFDRKADTNGEVWQVKETIRSMVRFKKYNLLDSFSSLGIFDIVFCRNVLIYFDPQTKIDVLERINGVMLKDSFVMLGAAETIVGLTDVFQMMPAYRGLYTPASLKSGLSLSPQESSAL